MDTNTEFQTGMSVIYGLHGKCSIKDIVTREIDGQTIPFYKLEVQKSPLARSTRQDSAIWVPVDQARARGLRLPLTAAEADDVFAVLSNREYYFPLNENWANVHPKLESTMRGEGLIGLAKVLSYLYVLRRRQVVPTSEVVKLYETVQRLLVRELAEALNQQNKSIEEKIEKVMRPKLLADH